MSKAINDIDDPRLVKALAHPLRVRILGLLEHRTLSPKQLATELGLPVENVSYHVRTLRRLGFIKLVRTRQVRGTIEHYYDLVAPPRMTAEAWAKLPDIVKEAMTGANLAQISDIVNRAAGESGFSRPESHLQRMPYTLDEQGFSAASEIISDALERIEKVERDARRRIGAGRSEPVPAVAVVMLFDAPSEVASGTAAPAPVKRRKGRQAAAVAGA
jgi:DNA-binding transcriptional ArsR family regulator